MQPKKGLPLPRAFEDTETYVESLLHFVSSCEILQSLIGHVHILDFFTRQPDLYASLLDQDWRAWFDLHEFQGVIEFMLREDLDQFSAIDKPTLSWRAKPLPPKSLVHYVHNVRRHALNRDFFAKPKEGLDTSRRGEDAIPRHVAVGMKVKKIHEVDHFSRYIQQLTADMTVSKNCRISHLVDFGSGQNYLGRTLASQPYNQHVIAVESKAHNITGAKSLDVMAKIAPKNREWVNKKEYKARIESGLVAEKSTTTNNNYEEPYPPQPRTVDLPKPPPAPAVRAKLVQSREGIGSIQYVEHELAGWDLSTVIDEITADTTITDEATTTANSSLRKPSLLVMSIHSCGNLSHHGIRSILNPSVKAVAIVGCCYNLVTERLTPPSYKHPNLRPEFNPWSRPLRSPVTGDPNGFPMSTRVSNSSAPVHLNITARMFAVQAPLNWGPDEYEAFFTRNFYRALLQKIFLDRGLIEVPSVADDTDNSYKDGTAGERVASPDAVNDPAQPIIIGSLGKASFKSFPIYVRSALARVFKDPTRGTLFQEKMGDISDEEILRYEATYLPRKKELNIVWTLISFSAVLVESVMVVDRWLWLKEQEEVADAWVEPVFDYKKSPRNLVVVGIKK